MNFNVLVAPDALDAPDAQLVDAPDAPDVPDAQLVDALPALRETIIGTYGSVMLIDAMPRLVEPGGLGPEAAVVQAARVSTGAGAKTAQSDAALMRYLFRHAHMTPFEMVVLKWRVRAPLFTARQWMRHRTGSFNEQSARYGVVPTEFYIPRADEVLAQSRTNKQGSAGALEEGAANEVRASVAMAYAASEAAYEGALAQGVARELARIALPEGRYTTFYWTVNLRNLFHFLELRMAPEAQADIREYSNAMFGVLRRYCPLATRAFEDYQLHAVRLSALEVRALCEGAPPEDMTQRERADWQRKRAQLKI